MVKLTIIRYLVGLNFYLTNYFISCFPSHLVRNFFLKVTGLKLGRRSIIYGKFEIRNQWKIKVGKNTSIGHKCTLDGRGGITIGNNVNMSSEVMVWTWQHDYNDPNFGITAGEVIIEDYAWISARTIILPNTKIGKGAVVAAGAVVTKNVEPFDIVAGIPAKVIGKRNQNLEYNPAESKIPFI